MSMKPTNKVVAGVLAGAVTGVLVWLAKDFGGREIPVEAASSISVIITFLVQYFVSDAEPPVIEEAQ